MTNDPPAPAQDSTKPAGVKTAGFQLSAVETRVLGCLMEKEKTTPEVYPLTLNGLVNACNQTSNRDPVVHYEEAVVQHGLDRLRQKKLANEVLASGARVRKFRHTIANHYELSQAEFAVLCVLLLRGAQTVGELRTRSERIYTFFTLEEAVSCLEALRQRADPLTQIVPAGPGQKEHRYIQLLSAFEEPAPAAPERKETILVDAARLESMEGEIQYLKAALESLREEFAKFKKQFE
jgi:uncharacterized protein YceH (UPF0502 family)